MHNKKVMMGWAWKQSHNGGVAAAAAEPPTTEDEDGDADGLA